MFDIFKKEIKVSDKVKLFLTTGKEPEGEIVEIGDNYVLIKTSDGTNQRYFEQLIGGWTILRNEMSISRKNFPEINVELVSDLIDQIIEGTPHDILDRIIEPNANIIEVRGTTCIAANNESQKILLINNRIIDPELIEELKSFQIGNILPIVCIYYTKKGKDTISTSAIKPKSLLSIFTLMKHYLRTKEYYNISTLMPYFKNANFFFRELGVIRKELKKIKPPILSKPKTIAIEEEIDKDEKDRFKKIEREINKLISSSNFELAIEQIQAHLQSSLPEKYKSSLLLKKAQLFSSQNRKEDSIKTYKELIDFNKRIGSKENNISHLYTELARLQSLEASKLNDALESLRKAIEYNPRNAFAEKILNQIENKIQIVDGKNESIRNEKTNEVEELIIENTDEVFSFSKLIEIDLKEHNFTHREILNNDGISSPAIAKKILDQAKEKREGEISERFPMYLEAAKAYSTLNIGSYDSSEYIEAIAFYSMLKGNSLFIRFRNKVLRREFDKPELSRLRDSACSYYIEALNLFSNINSKLLLGILNNYLKLNIVFFYVRNDQTENIDLLFKGQFSDTFEYCIKNKELDIEKIGYQAIIACGASSINTWNKLWVLPKGTKRLYGEFSNEQSKTRIYNLIEEIEEIQIDKSLNPGAFLKTAFVTRRNNINKFQRDFTMLYNIDFTAEHFQRINKEWEKLIQFDKLLNDTDREIKNEIDNFITLIQPYLNRSQSERTNILIQSRKKIENTLIFIENNTTFFGRVLFYGILKKWKKEVDNLLEEKISLSYPKPIVVIDPPYIIKDDESYEVPVLIQNIGESTTSGFKMKVVFESTVYDENEEHNFDVSEEIASGQQIKVMIRVPQSIIDDSIAVETTFIIAPKYQDTYLPESRFEFTIEIEPTSTLTYDDIPWKDGPIPEEHMFKGRKKVIYDLAHHYLSLDRDKPYIIYGLTRTGKSSILKYLAKELNNELIRINKKDMRIMAFSWDLSIAASQYNAADFYDYILYQNLYSELEDYLINNEVNCSNLNISNKVRFKDLKNILDFMAQVNLYPIFFVDEFSFIKNLIDSKTINPAFLQSLRQFSLNGLASFVFAGTYDIKRLIKDPKYGITGQLVNAIEMQINEIKPEHSEELISVIDDQLSFTPEAIEHIQFLSGNVPYFVQIICKNCGYYAVEKRRRYIGYPELETVVEILIGVRQESPKSLIKKLPEGNFQNNQFSPQDPKEVSALISTIAYFNKDNIVPRGISLAELERFWGELELSSFRPKLSDAIMTLKERKILNQSEDEGIPIYTLSVDLFRRWWNVHHPDILLELNTLKES